MTSMPDQNWLIIVGALFSLSGIALLGKAFWAFLDAPASGGQSVLKRNEARVASWFGLPMLGIGFFSQAAGQMTTAHSSPLTTCFMLALALTLLLYGMLEANLVESISAPAMAKPETPRIALPPPNRMEVIETTVDDVRLLKAAATA